MKLTLGCCGSRWVLALVMGGVLATAASCAGADGGVASSGTGSVGPSQGPVGSPPASSGASETPRVSLPSSSPSPLTIEQQAEAKKQENIAAAEATYREYIGALNVAYRNGGGQGEYEKIVKYLGTPERMESLSAQLKAELEQGLHQVGGTEITNAVPIGYQGDPLGKYQQVVRFSVCLDNTSNQMVGADGDRALPRPENLRGSGEVELANQVDGRWTVTETMLTGSSC